MIVIGTPEELEESAGGKNDRRMKNHSTDTNPDFLLVKWRLNLLPHAMIITLKKSAICNHK